MNNPADWPRDNVEENDMEGTDRANEEVGPWALREPVGLADIRLVPRRAGRLEVEVTEDGRIVPKPPFPPFDCYGCGSACTPRGAFMAVARDGEGTEAGICERCMCAVYPRLRTAVYEAEQVMWGEVVVPDYDDEEVPDIAEPDRNPADIRIQPNRMFCRFLCFWCGESDKHGDFLFIVNHEGTEKYICDCCAEKAMPDVYAALQIAGSLWFYIERAENARARFLDICKALKGAGYPVAGYESAATAKKGGMT